MSSRMQLSLADNLVIDNFVCSFRYFTSTSNLKAAIGRVLMEILKIWGMMRSVVRLRTQLF